MSAERTSSQPRSIRKVVVASLIGTSLEWYDFFLYGSAAALVFNKLFFPEADPLTGTLLAFATSATGVAAPILLVVLRFVQGLGLGGEWGGAVLMSLEHGEPDRRGWNASWPQVG
jgi:MFS family permease